MTIKLYANPYDQDSDGFYFSSYDEYVKKQTALRNRFGLPVEEFEISLIDAEDSATVDIINAMKIDQPSLERCLEFLETSDESTWPAVFFLLDNCGRDLDYAIEKADDYCVVESTLIDAATDLFDECYGHQIPDAVKNYIDYESFARDCKLGGDMVEFTFGGLTYTCTNACQ